MSDRPTTSDLWTTAVDGVWFDGDGPHARKLFDTGDRFANEDIVDWHNKVVRQRDAAKRERVMLQSLAYDACSTIDKLLGRSVSDGTNTTCDPNAFHLALIAVESKLFDLASRAEKAEARAERLAAECRADRLCTGAQTSIDFAEFSWTRKEARAAVDAAGDLRGGA